MQEDVTLEQILEELERRKTEGGVYERYFNTPETRATYPKHLEFFRSSANNNLTAFVAGNQCGKSVSAATALTFHLTGIYPDWWEGRRFDSPVNCWIVGRTAELVRQTIQPMLLGQVGQPGTGFIPKHCLDLDTLTDAKRASTPVSSFRVKHSNGGYSTVALKSGEQGREAFQAATLDLCWVDEEIPFDVFNECMVRLLVKEGLMLVSFTPLKGTTDIIRSLSVDGVFTEGQLPNGAYVVRCSMRDVGHITKEQVDALEASTPPFLRQARIDGIPALGAGAIYPVPEDVFVIDPQPIPKHWPRLYGMDVGSKTAAVWLAINPDQDEMWAFGEYYREDAEPSIHAAGIKAKGQWIPGAIDPASRGRSQIDGQRLMEMYQELDLKLSKADNAVEAGLYTVWELLSTGRLKIFNTCTGLLQEMRAYHRDEKGRVVKKFDHRCDSLRYAVMTRDIATVEKPVNIAPLSTVYVNPIRM